jgi:RES domain
MPVIPVTRPSQQLRQFTVSQTAESTRSRFFSNDQLASTPSDSCSEPLFRAEIGNRWRKEPVDHSDPNGDYVEVPHPYDPARMKPPKDMSREGRVNPKGILCLYLADERNTAMAETRPWLGSYVSSGEFKTTRPQRIMSLPEPKLALSMYVASLFGGSLPDAASREGAVWGEISYAFSEPVTASDHQADYAATQILAETFRSIDCDGIRYKSRLGKGYSIALFDLESAILVGCGIFQTRELLFAFSLAGNPYYVS